MNSSHDMPDPGALIPFPEPNSLVAGSYVIDASVGVKWFAPEKDSTLARQLVSEVQQGLRQLVAPPLFWLEVANALRHSPISDEDLYTSLEALARYPVRPVEVHKADLPATAALARRLGLTIYDATYVAVSLRYGIPLITEDRKLASACAAASVPVYTLEQVLGYTLMEMMAPYIGRTTT